MLRVFDPSLSRGAFSIDGQATVALGIFDPALPRRARAVLREPLVVFDVFYAPLTGRSRPVLSEAFVARSVFHASLSAPLHLTVRGRVGSGGLFRHASGGLAATFFFPGRHAGIQVSIFGERT